MRPVVDFHRISWNFWRNMSGQKTKPTQHSASWLKLVQADQYFSAYSLWKVAWVENIWEQYRTFESCLKMLASFLRPCFAICISRHTCRCCRVTACYDVAGGWGCQRSGRFSRGSDFPKLSPYSDLDLFRAPSHVAFCFLIQFFMITSQRVCESVIVSTVISAQNLMALNLGWFGLAISRSS